MPKHFKKTTRKEVELIRNLYKAGESVDRIAGRLNKDRSTIYYWLKHLDKIGVDNDIQYRDNRGGKRIRKKPIPFRLKAWAIKHIIKTGNKRREEVKFKELFYDEVTARAIAQTIYGENSQIKVVPVIIKEDKNYNKKSK